MCLQNYSWLCKLALHGLLNDAEAELFCVCRLLVCQSFCYRELIFFIAGLSTAERAVASVALQQ